MLNLVLRVLEGAAFTDGVEVTKRSKRGAAA